MATPNKSLGQHWLHDRDVLADIADEAQLDPDTTVLEIGPGLGTLTSQLLRRAGSVIAVEFDSQLAAKLPGSFPGTNLTVHHEDILQFNLDALPRDYVVVANVPYYITAKIIQRLVEADNPPKRAVLLVQKEVAQRLAAQPGAMSVLAVATQLSFSVSLGNIVPPELFTPPPKVDSQVVILERRDQPLIAVDEAPALLRVVKAGFGERRKKLRSSLSGGLRLSKSAVDDALLRSGIALEARAQELSIAQWRELMQRLERAS